MTHLRLASYKHDSIMSCPIVKSLGHTERIRFEKSPSFVYPNRKHTYPFVRSILSHGLTSHVQLVSHDHKQLRWHEYTHTHKFPSVYVVLCMTVSSPAVERGKAGGPEDSWFNNLTGTPLWSICFKLCTRQICKQLPQGEVWICTRERTKVTCCCDYRLFLKLLNVLFSKSEAEQSQ